MFFTITQSKVQELVLGRLSAPAIEKELRKKYSLSRLEQNALLLIHWLEEQSVYAKVDHLVLAGIAHQRSTQQIVEKLIAKGFVERKKVNKRRGRKLLMTDQGRMVIHASSFTTRMLAKHIIKLK